MLYTKYRLLLFASAISFLSLSRSSRLFISICSKNFDTSQTNILSHLERRVLRPREAQNSPVLPVVGIYSILHYEQPYFDRSCKRLFKNKCETHSGTPSGGTTIEIMLSINLYFKIRSFTVVEVSDGDAFTCRIVGKVN